MTASDSPFQHSCPSCGGSSLRNFYQVGQVPVHSVLLMPSRDKATSYTRGDIELAFCDDCGFIFNRRFDASLHEYSQEYEETQGFSGTFNKFHRRLATDLINRYDLRNKEIVEIGCGKGEFLTLLCEIGENRGTGFDPAFISERLVPPAKGEVNFVKDFYSEKYSHYKADFFCCKMTLEHIPDTADFIRTVRAAVGDDPDNIVFFQVPNTAYILKDLAFWDVYYEHCSYFSTGSLARLFRNCGFDVLDLGLDYDDQYLMVEARPGDGQGTPPHPLENDMADLRSGLSNFIENAPLSIAGWRKRLNTWKAEGKRVAIWGSGSKGVSFLTTLKVSDEIAFGVDINPNKHGTFLAGSGHEIVGPEHLKSFPPDVVIVMNPIYCEEIGRDLAAMGLNPEMVAV